MPLLRLPCLLGILAFSPLPAFAQEGPLKDANGDPLPPGAFARLGSTRFRVSGAVFGARFVDGGKKLVVRVQKPPTFFSSDEGTFHLFDFESGRDLGQFELKLNHILGHWRSTGLVRDGIDFSDWCVSPDGRLIANIDGWRSSELHVRELSTGKEVLSVKDENTQRAFVQFSPDGKHVAAVVRRVHEGTEKEKGPLVVIRIWDLQTGKEIRTLLPPLQPAATFQAHWFMFSPDGAYLAATGYEQGKAGIVRVWDVAGKSPSWQLEGATAKRDQARPIAIAPDSKMLAAVCDDKISLWDLATGKHLKDVAAYNNRCATLDFSPDGKLLMAGAGKQAAIPGELRLFEVSSGREIPLPVWNSRGYVFSDSGEILVLADANPGNLLICNAATGKIQTRIDIAVPKGPSDDLEHQFYKARQGMGWPFALSPDGKTLVACDQPGQLRRFDVATGKPIPAPGLAADPASALVFSLDGKKLLAGGLGRVLLHHTDGITPPLEFAMRVWPDGKGRRPNETPTAMSLAFSPDGRQAATGWDNGGVAVWDAATGKLLWHAQEHEGQIISLAFAPDDRTLFSTGRDGIVNRWSAATGQVHRKMVLHGDEEYYNRGQFVLGPAALTAWHRKSANDWQEYEFFSGKMRRGFPTEGYPAGFSQDGHFLLVDGQHAFDLFDLISGELQRSFSFADSKRAIYNPAAKARFSPDGRMIAGVAGNDIVRVWDRDTATLLTALSSHNGGVLAVAFAPDGQTLATSSGDGTILLWRTPPRHIATAKALPPSNAKLPASGKDKEGESLPAAATARLGLLRFQQGKDIAAVRYSSDSKSILALATFPEDGLTWLELALWDAATGKMKNQMTVTGMSHGGTGIPFGPRSWTVSEDGKLLAVSGRFTEISTGKAIFPAKEPDVGDFSARFAPDGKTVLDLDKLTLIDMATGRERKLEGLDDKLAPSDGRFSPNGKYLLATDGFGAIYWWDLDRGGKPKKALAEYLNDLPVFSGDSKYFAMFAPGEGDKKPHLVLIDTASGNTIRDFGEHHSYAKLLISPDGKQLVTIAMSDQSRLGTINEKQVWLPPKQIVRRWDVASGKELSSKETTGSMVRFSPDSRILALGIDRQIQLLDADSGRELRRLSVGNALIDEGFASSFSFLKPQSLGGGPFAFSPDGKLIAVAAERTIRQFEVATGKEIGPVPHWQTTLAVALSNNGQRVASWSLGYVQVWDAAKNSIVLRVEPWSGREKEEVSLTSVALAPDGNCLAVGASDGAIALFDVTSAKRIRLLKFHAAPVCSLVFAADGTSLVSADANAHIAFWHVASGALADQKALAAAADKKATWQVGYARYYGGFDVQNSEGQWINSWNLPAIATDARRLLILEDKTIRLWDFTGPKPKEMQIPHDSREKVAIAPNGSLLGLAVLWQANQRRNDESMVQLVDAASGKELRAFIAPWVLTDCCFSPSGTLLAACGEQGLRLWNVANGTPLADFNGHRGAVTAVAFSPDGGTLVSAGNDGTLLVWDVAALLARPVTKDLAADELPTLWEQLAGQDPADAGQAMRRLAAHQRQAVNIFREKLKPSISPPKEFIAKLVADLDSAQPKIRDSVNRDLEKLAELAEPALRACLAAQPTLEQKMRADNLLARLGAPITDGEKLRALRAVEVLELMGTPQAAEVLHSLAEGADCAYVTREAIAALKRIGAAKTSK